MNIDDQQDEREQRIIRRIEKLRVAGYSYEALLRHAAEGWDWADFMEGAYEKQQEAIGLQDQALDMISSIEIALQTVVVDLLSSLDLSKETIQKIRLNLPGLIERQTVKTRSELARKAVESSTKTQESRRNKSELRNIWAEGMYRTRDDCVEDISRILGMKLSTARKALQGTPDPNPWPAKDTKK